MDGDFLLLHRMQNGDDQAIESFVRMSYSNENAYQIGLYAGVSAVAYNKDLTGIVASPVSDFYISKLSWK